MAGMVFSEKIYNGLPIGLFNLDYIEYFNECQHILITGVTAYFSYNLSYLWRRVNHSIQ